MPRLISTRSMSLRARLALWMLASAGLSLLTFAVAAYVFVSLEEREDLSSQAPPETPSEIASETAEEMLVAMGLAAPVALLVSLGGAIWISRRTLGPVRAVIRTAEEMGAHDLHRRLQMPSSDPELAELLTALNQLFERLESGFGALERYAVDASHELRTPLAVLASELEVALRHERSPAQWQQVAETVLDEVQRLTRLVEALLALARFEALPPGNTVSIDLHDAIEQVVARMELPAKAAELSLVVEAFPPEALTVVADVDAFATALTGLLANAIRYTPAGGEVRVSVKRAVGDRIDIRVDDSGPGVPEAEREAVFLPFARGSAGRAVDERSGKSGGFGLGLAMVRRVAELHAGTVEVVPSPLGGARFVLSLPSTPR